ncbi:MAG: hypothetical protein WA102_04270 [Candidatus Methanoperedens sp.]
MLPTKFTTKSELISEFVINPILQSESFLKIKVKNLRNINENAITDELIRYLKYHSKYSHLYQTHIDVSVRYTQVNKTSINNEPDIKFLIGEVTNKIVFEAKRLNPSSSESDYCGNEGFGRFLTGYYEINEYCGMLGYMQTGKIDIRIKKIQENLKNLDFVDFISLFSNCFQSIHENNKMKLKCYHLILDLR